MPNNRNPNFVVVKESETFIIIRDVGPWDKHRSITNGAEECISDLANYYKLGSRRVGYYDSEGQLDELLHDGQGRFTGFSPGFKAGEAEVKAVVAAFAEHTPFLGPPSEAPSGPITFDESKMTDEQRVTLLPRLPQDPERRSQAAFHLAEIRACYPPDWPSCPGCGLPAMDGHITCGRAGCSEGSRR